MRKILLIILETPILKFIIDNDGTLSIEFGAYGVPETFIISKNKEIIKRFIGPINNEILKEIKLILKMKFIKIILIIFSAIYFTELMSGEKNDKLKNKILKNIRCLICQGQSIYDSDSDFAMSIKIVVEKKINERKI